MSNRTLRLALFNSQGHRCYYCDEKMNMGKANHTNPASCTIDHKDPQCTGRGYKGNSAGACWRCNNLKGSRTAVEFFQWIKLHPLPPLVRHKAAKRAPPVLPSAIPEKARYGLKNVTEPCPGVATYKLGDKFAAMFEKNRIDDQPAGE